METVLLNGARGQSTEGPPGPREILRKIFLGLMKVDMLNLIIVLLRLNLLQDTEQYERGHFLADPGPAAWTVCCCRETTFLPALSPSLGQTGERVQGFLGALLQGSPGKASPERPTPRAGERRAHRAGDGLWANRPLQQKRLQSLLRSHPQTAGPPRERPRPGGRTQTPPPGEPQHEVLFECFVTKC
ncbi:hypothetical protein KUCAC02_030748 [Chaenocephalus aceratus]|uniref:Uncharacterized protein n=1 Tax=Chaenocephalus aceratus TaxID=36190 RepID=A0ACB9XJU9_CHAAC|nr:hypothetical protein KUCAC02_030748 [Chaenocephalus aceratus]